MENLPQGSARDAVETDAQRRMRKNYRKLLAPRTLATELLLLKHGGDRKSKLHNATLKLDE